MNVPLSTYVPHSIWAAIIGVFLARYRGRTVVVVLRPRQGWRPLHLEFWSIVLGLWVGAQRSCSGERRGIILDREDRGTYLCKGVRLWECRLSA